MFPHNETFLFPGNVYDTSEVEAHAACTLSDRNHNSTIRRKGVTESTVRVVHEEASGATAVKSRDKSETTESQQYKIVLGTF